MKTVKEIIIETLLEETPFTESKCEQVAEKLVKKLGMEKTKIIEGKDFKPSQTLLAHLLDTMPNGPTIIGEAEEQNYAESAKKIGGKEILLKKEN